MKQILLTLLIALCSLTLCAAELPPATAILAATRAQLPPYPVFMSGELKEKAPNGFVKKKLAIEMTLNWGDTPPSADYTITDKKSGTSQSLNVRWTRDTTEPAFFQDGQPADYNPHAEIADSGVTWSDLTFSFLWSPDAQTVGQDTHFGSERYKISIPRPGGLTLTLWIEKETGRLSRAEEYNADGDLKKVIDVKSVQKFDDLWMVKDVDIIQPETEAKTSLRIETVIANPE